jgi:cell division topological specificity factor
MAWYDIFRSPPPTASVAKDRLQIIVARERHALSGQTIGYLPQLQQELLQVIAKYEKVDLDQVSVSIDRRDNAEILELNIILPDESLPPPREMGRPFVFA